jgi:uncharacterized membrane-anchored protein YitT (DUF2179 family)
MPDHDSTAADLPPAPATVPHSLLDDAQALVTGTLFAGLGLLLFRQAGLMTGGTVGLAFLAHYASGWAFEPLFFALNLPFYLMAWRRLGPRFTLNTVAAVSLLTLFSRVLPQLLQVRAVQPLFAALAGGLLVGCGFIILFRHRASLGGLNVLVLWCQEHLGWRAGVVQLVLDASILLAASPWLSWQRLGLSIVAAAAMNFTLALNHRPGRYRAF